MARRFYRPVNFPRAHPRAELDVFITANNLGSRARARAPAGTARRPFPRDMSFVQSPIELRTSETDFALELSTVFVSRRVTIRRDA